MGNDKDARDRKELGATRRERDRQQAEYDRRRGYDLDSEGNSFRDRD